MNPILENNNNILKFISKLPEFYCLEDFGNITMFHNFFNKININSNKKLEPEKYIEIIFFIEGKEKEIVKEIIEAKKFFLFIKIYYNQYSINILIHKNFKLNNNEILNKINLQKNLKTPIKINLKIHEFPLKNYYLEELEYNYDNNIDKAFILKSLSATIMLQNNLNQKFNNSALLKINQDKMDMKNNNINNINNMNYQNNGQNIIKNNIINTANNVNNDNNNSNFYNQMVNLNNNNINMNRPNKISWDEGDEELYKRINQLEKELKEEKINNDILNKKNIELTKKNQELNKIIMDLKNEKYKKEKNELLRYNVYNVENILENKYNINRLIDLLNELNMLKEKLPSESSKKEEKLIVVIITSTDQKIYYPIVCRNTDEFSKLESELYRRNEYKEYKDGINHFISNGKRINRFDTLEQNKIKNGDKILLIKEEE